ncbi:MAG: ABC transporter permease [Chloroflexi bacterium]|jgi:osmoprotectant transport system permease protein|nr:ABC transporter permease [Anaerolineaceae bacterium]NMB89331.1 ABC transporter permease [Chloroflexota bacterium]
MKAQAAVQKLSFSTLFNWTAIPLLAGLTVWLLYTYVMLPIAPGSMEANIVGSTESGFGAVGDGILEHLRLVLISTGLAIATGVPAGILITREGFRDFSGIVLSVANFGQSVPSIAILALFMGVLGLGATTAIFALWLYALLPIVRNTAIGIESVRPDIIEAATGMGMTRRQILLEIELPLAFPVIFAGMRTATVINVGTAALGAFIGAGGLGDFIITGIPLRRDSLVLVGAVLTAVLAVLGDWILGKIQDRLVVRTA